MIYRVDFRDDAKQDIIDATQYYEEKSVGLGSKFLDVVESYIKKIAENPQHYQIQSGNCRTAYIREFPYLIVYEIDGNTLIIYSVFHAKQDPEKKFPSE